MEDNTLLGANFIAMPETETDVHQLDLDTSVQNNLVGIIKSRFEESARARQLKEHQWLKAYQNYRGEYGKNVRFNEHEKSRVFVKITKTKVLAAFGMLNDVLFSTNKFPLGVSATDVPEGSAERAHLKTDGETSVEDKPEPEQDVENPFDPGYDGDGKTLAPGATFRSPTKFLKDMVSKFEDPTGNVVLEEGSAPSPDVPEINLVKEAARQLEKLIHDQLEESNAEVESRNALFEMCLLGSLCIKGPYSYDKTLHNWVEDEEGNRTYQPVTVRVPRIEFVSIWDVYPDAHCTSIADCDYLIQRRKLTRSDFRALLRLPGFDKDKVRECLLDGPNYEVQDYEYTIRTDDSSDTSTIGTDRFEVLEYWGTMDAMSAKEMGIAIPDSVDELDEIQVNVWICGNKMIRGVVNPFIPARLPYHICPYEKNPYSIWGIGVAENMEDSQLIMNGHARMAIDNLALSGSVVFDIDEAALVPGQSPSIYPGKVFRRQSGQPGQAVYALKFPNTSNENLMMFDKFRQLADEQTGIPSFSHGQTGVQSMTRTASGMSMLMGAASINIKTVVKNVDDFLLKPLGVDFFRWNQQFFKGKLGIKQDLEVKALGTTSLMQKEVRSQRLTMFMQTASNPAIAPYVKMSTLIKEFAHSIDLDPRELINTPEEVAIAQALLGAQNGQGQTQGAGQQPNGMGAPQGIPGGAAATDPTGTGNGAIVPGNVQEPGSDSFSG